MAPLMNREQFVRSLEVPEESCPICYEPYTSDNNHESVRLACGHWVGKKCLLRSIEVAPSPNRCPPCRDEMYCPGAQTQPADRQAGCPVANTNNDLSFSIVSRMEAWKPVYQMDSTLGVAFMQLLWKTIHPFATRYILEADNEPSASDLLQRAYEVIIRNIFRNIPENDPRWNIVRRFPLVEQEVIRLTMTDLDSFVRQNLCLGRLVKDMSYSPAMWQTDHLTADFAKLWWTIFQANNDHQFRSSLPEISRMHWLAVQLAWSISVKPGVKYIYWAHEEMWLKATMTLDSTVQNWDLHKEVRRSIHTKIARMCHSTASQVRPPFIGATGEEDQVLRLLRKPRLNPIKYDNETSQSQTSDQRWISYLLHPVFSLIHQ